MHLMSFPHGGTVVEFHAAASAAVGASSVSITLTKECVVIGSAVGAGGVPPAVALTCGGSSGTATVTDAGNTRLASAWWTLPAGTHTITSDRYAVLAVAYSGVTTVTSAATTNGTQSPTVDGIKLAIFAHTFTRTVTGGTKRAESGSGGGWGTWGAAVEGATSTASDAALIHAYGIS